jgi:hypothetical protein
MASYDVKAIFGEKLKRLTDKTLKAIVDCMCTLAASLCSLEKRISALESVEIPEGGYKPMQEPVASPTASGSAIQFIESVSQDATGRMTAAKKTVRSASTSQTGLVQLTDSHSSTSTSTAATPKNVKEAYDLASGKADPASVVDSATYDSSSHTIIFKHGSTQLFTLDAAAFVKDGMVDSVAISNGNLVITFNTDAGKQPISIPLTDIFNPNNYYTKTQTDTLLSSKQDSLPESSGKYGIDISGNADTATTAQTANYAGEAEKTSKTVGTYGENGYRGIFAGYNSTGDNEGVVVQLADKRSGTSSATEITPQGMVTSGSVTATGGFHGNADSATTAQFAQESNRSATADVATLASSLSDSKGTPGQTGYKNIFAGYNNGTSEYGIGIAKKESGGDKATEITADGISTTGQITAGGGFVGNLTGNATSATSAMYDDEGHKISSYYKGVYEMLPTISKNPLETAASGAHQQLSPYVGNSPHSYNLNKSIYMAVLNFVAMDFGGYDFSTVDLELRSFPFGDTQANPYGKLLSSVGVIVPKGNSTITVAIPFDLSNNILENKSFYPTLFGSFGSVIFGGAINGTHFYFSTPAI